MALARTMVREGGELTALLRAYRFGQAIFSTWWNEALGERVQEPRLLARALDSSLTFVFEYLDAVCMRLVQVFTEERERWLRSSAAVRAAMVDAILAGEAVEPELASARLGYELRRHHLGLVLWVEGGTGEHAFQHLEQAAGRLAAAVGASRPLLVPAGPGQLWLWAGAFSPAELEGLSTLAEELTDVRVAAGRWSEGPDGFRTTHEEAQHARRVARLAGPEPAALTCYDDVVIPSLLSADLERTRRFVAETLGPLGVEEDGMRRLRVTLQAFLGEGSSHVGAARRLHVHQNTVAYRVHRADELLGGRLARDRLQIELALALADRLGDAVLQPAAG
jgi:DNA-binding PucR family transcriptional regulator